MAKGIKFEHQAQRRVAVRYKDEDELWKEGQEKQDDGRHPTSDCCNIRQSKGNQKTQE